MMDTPSGRFRRQNKNSPGGHKCLRRISLSVLLCEKTRSGLQTWKSIGEKMFVCCAESVASGGIPVALAATPAEQPVSTGCTFCGRLWPCARNIWLVGELSACSTVQCFISQVSTRPGHKNRRDKDFRHPLLQDSVHRSRRMHRRSAHSQQDAQIIFEITDADIMSLLQLLIPNIKNAAQKTAIEFRR